LDVERFNVRKLSELDIRKQYQIKISDKSAALRSLNGSKDVNRAWEHIKDNAKISAKMSLALFEWKQHKPWFDEECSQFVDQGKQAKMQWMRDRNISNMDNLNNVRHVASRYFRDKKR
jgi:hypothetical protein